MKITLLTTPIIYITVTFIETTLPCPFAYRDRAVAECIKQKIEGLWRRRVNDGKGAVQGVSVDRGGRARDLEEDGELRDEEVWAAHFWIRRGDVFEAALRHHRHLSATHTVEVE